MRKKFSLITMPFCSFSYSWLCGNIKFFFVALAVILCSCSTTHLKYIGKDNWVEAMSNSSLTTGQLSYQSRYFLTGNALMDKFQNNPQEVIKQLAEYVENPDDNPMAIREQTNIALFVLIELCTYEAQHSSGDEAMKYWMSACFYSYKYLFDKSANTELTPYSSLEYAAVLRFYDYTLSEIFSYYVDNNISLEAPSEFPMVIGKVKLAKVKSDLIWNTNKFTSYINGYDYLPINLQSHSYVAGLGVPILGLQKYDSTTKLNKELVLVSLVYPFTFLIEFESFDLKKGSVEAVPGIFNSYNDEFIDIKGNIAPLSKDYSLALGKCVDMCRGRISGFDYMLNPDKMGDLQGLYMLAPYNPNKIPVVFVHGLMSSPGSWMEMINTLMNDRAIHENYQFWLYAYPTGDPIYYSEYKFRKALTDIRDKYNPDNKNQKFNDMVIVGHSMGGLLTRISVQSSNGTEFMEKMMNMKIDDLKLTDAQRKFLMEVGVFQALPFVRSIVLISTPNKGSEMATFTFARFGSYLISLPSAVVQNSSGVLQQVAFKLHEGEFDIPDGIDELAPTSKFLLDSYELPVKKDVDVHSIIGNEDKAGEKSGSDGIVSYSSAHLPYAQSELVIKSDHSAETKPECIKEVFRILLEHLKECNINSEQSSSGSSGR